MPRSAPLKVRISPNAVRIVGWISASGGQKKPATSSMPPKTHRPTDKNSCIVFIFEARDFFLKQKYASFHSLQKYLKIWYYLLLPYVRLAHIINNRSIAPIKASFIASLDRLLLIDYCITNPAVIKYSSNALRTIQCSPNYTLFFEPFNVLRTIS